MNTPRALPSGLYEVESESDPETTYVMEPGRSCSCPHFSKKLAGSGSLCKHLRALDAHMAPTVEDRFKTALLTASRVSDALLPVLLEKHGENALVQTALIYERTRREQAAAADEVRKAIFR